MQHLTELEEKLSKPGGLAVQQQLLAALTETALRLRHKLAASVPRAEFELYEKALYATQAAVEVLQSWPVALQDKALEEPLSPFSVQVPALLHPFPEAELSSDSYLNTQ